MKKFVLLASVLFACQLFMTQGLHIDGKWLLMNVAMAQESDRGFDDDTIYPLEEDPKTKEWILSAPVPFDGAKNKVFAKSVKNRCSVTLNYPFLGNPAVDKAIGAWLNNTSAIFIKAAVKTAKEMGGFRPWEMQGTYAMTQAGPNVVSVLFRMYLQTGGGHGSDDYACLTFDKNTGKQLAKNDFFMDEKQALTILSQYCRAEFVKNEEIGDNPSMRSATEPKQGNFSVFVPRPKGILIVFAAGEVASYAAGTRTIFVPLEKFRDCIEPGKIWQ